MTVKVRLLTSYNMLEDEKEFDTFIEAVDYVRDVLGPTAYEVVIEIDTTER